MSGAAEIIATPAVRQRALSRALRRTGARHGHVIAAVFHQQNV